MDKSQLNPYFQNLKIDYLYHLGLDSEMDLKKTFGQIKHVIFTRSFAAADYISNLFASQYYGISEVKIHCATIAKDERYHIHLVAHTLIISHGVGFPSMLICLNEIIKLLCHAGVEQPQFFRIGTADGLGLAENQVVIAHSALSPELKPEWRNIEFGEYYTYSTEMDADLAKAIILANPKTNLISAKILSGFSFYTGQARLNGALATSYTSPQRDAYLTKAYNLGVRALDLESACFAAICRHFAIPAAIIAASIVDRLIAPDTELARPLLDQNPAPAIQNASNLLINYLRNT